MCPCAGHVECGDFKLYPELSSGLSAVIYHASPFVNEHGASVKLPDGRVNFPPPGFPLNLVLTLETKTHTEEEVVKIISYFVKNPTSQTEQ